MTARQRWTAIFGAGTALTGLWAFFAPASFYEFATYPPYNRHFIHDAGAFLTGLGAVLLAAVVWRDALFVALAGNAAGAWLHAISHLMDRDLGGGSWRDPILTIGLAIGLTALAVATRPRTGGTRT